MTTLVALLTKDALVMGCDSLGTVSKKLLDPRNLHQFFDPDNEFKLKLGSDGKPVLKDFRQLYNESQEIPYNQMTHVAKLFSLDPLPMGVMFAGIASIGDRTIKSLVEEFRTRDSACVQKPSPKNYTVHSVGGRLLDFLHGCYSTEFPEEYLQPELELLMGGYDKQAQVPSIARIRIHKHEIENVWGGRGFGIVFGGQMLGIQRLVFGTDHENTVRVIERVSGLMQKYRCLIEEGLKKSGIDYEVPRPESFGKELDLFEGWKLKEMDAQWADFSEQNAIECVDFFVDVMIRSQQFSERIPTVGGEVHIAVIRKQQKFKFISKETLKHGEHEVKAGEE